MASIFVILIIIGGCLGTCIFAFFAFFCIVRCKRECKEAAERRYNRSYHSQEFSSVARKEVLTWGPPEEAPKVIDADEEQPD